MFKRVISVLLIAVLAFGLLAACGKEGPLSVEDAKAVVLEDLGVKESKVTSMDVHLGNVDGVACYLVYVSYNGENFEYVVNGITGEILSVEETDSGHSH